MSFSEELDFQLKELSMSQEQAAAPINRFKAEIDFATQFIELFPDKKARWRKLILAAVDEVSSAAACDVDKAVASAEEKLAPVGEAAKEYTIHCCGHAHIDMNWMWPWPETVNVCHDTFATVDALMDEFPEFCFSQSQASTYIAMEEYAPEIYKMIKKRVKQGRWEITASMWVEGDKNIVSGESLCRHQLYTRKYFKDKMGLEPEDVKIDWSPDTFGHAHTLPSIITRGGASRYYFCRTGPGPWLFKWRSPDGSEVLAYNDKPFYNGVIEPGMARWIVDQAKETGLKDHMFMYGVGDHGGGPTRRDLRMAYELMKWPIYPTVKLSTTDAFYSAVEKANPDLPVIDSDLNFVFEGCYTSQSNIKYATRVSEIILPEAETLAFIAGSVDKMPYPSDLIFTGWRHTLFNHFHDILPGSGVHATYEYSQGLFQEVQAMAGSIRTRALRKLASNVNTTAAAQCKITTFGGLGDGLGAGAGDPSIPGGVTARNAGALCAEPFIIYNQKAWPRTETVYAKVWNKELADDKVLVRDSEGKEVKGQVISRGNYWGHNFTAVAFKAEDVPALGYKVYAIDNASEPVAGKGAQMHRSDACMAGSTTPFIREGGVMENEYLKVEVDAASGAVIHLIDKETGFDYVPEGKYIGLLEAYQEAPHGMTSWCIGQTPERTPLTDGGTMEVVHRGPNRVAVKTSRKYKDSTISVEVGLDAGAKAVEFTVQTRWVEIGSPEKGVPMLKASFAMNGEKGVPTYEIPFGAQERKQSNQEIPALKWADLTAKTNNGLRGITLANDSKYGHMCADDTMYLTLIRSSYDPDPLPEVKDHTIKFAVAPHEGACDVVEAIKFGEQFNSPMAVVSSTVQEGTLPAEKSFVEVLTPNVFISAVKKAEDSDGLVVRMFEAAGKKTTAKVRVNGLVRKSSKATETDVLERPLEKNTAKMTGDTVSVTIPAYGQATVKLGK